MNRNFSLLVALFAACVAVSAYGGGIVVDGGGAQQTDIVDNKTITNSTADSSNSIDAGAIKTGTVDDARLPQTIARDSELPNNSSFSFKLLYDIKDLASSAGQFLQWNGTSVSWATVDGGSGSSGVGTHSLLAGLDFFSSGHTGFASSGAIPNNASFSFGELNDVATRTGMAGRIWRVKEDESGYEWAIPATGTLGTIKFTDLADTPNSYSGKAGFYPAITIGETALYFASAGIALPDIASRAGAVLRVKDDESGVEWWEARDYVASFSTFVVLLATDSVTVLSSLASPSRGDVVMLENTSNWQGDYIAFGPAASTASQLRSGGHRLNKLEKFTARIATIGFDMSICSAHERVGTCTVSIFWGAK